MPKLDFAKLAKCFNRTFARKTYHLGDENTTLLDGEWYLIDAEDLECLRPVMDCERTVTVSLGDYSQQTAGKLMEVAHAEMDGKHYIRVFDPNAVRDLRLFIEYGLAVR